MPRGPGRGASKRGPALHQLSALHEKPSEGASVFLLNWWHVEVARATVTGTVLQPLWHQLLPSRETLGVALEEHAGTRG